MPKNAEEKWFPTWNPTHPDYQSSLGEENKNNFRQAQNKRIILQCWRSEVWNGSHGAKISQQGRVPPGAPGRRCTFPLPGQLRQPPACLGLWPRPPSSSKPARSIFKRLSDSGPAASLVQGPYDYTGPTWTVQENLPIWTPWPQL